MNPENPDVENEKTLVTLISRVNDKDRLMDVEDPLFGKVSDQLNS